MTDAKSKVFAKSALAAAKDAISVALPQMHGKVAVTETRVFGGKSVEVILGVYSNSWIIQPIQHAKLLLR